MYEYIKGIYEGMYRDYIVIENNGVGYKIYTSGSTLAKLPKNGEEVLIYLQQIVREDFIGLYGFLTREELNMFKLFLTINGVGAKAALSLLSISNVNNLKYAILSGDEKTIIKAPGIGKKMAQRIILELKDKIKTDELVSIENMEDNIEEKKENVSEALEALVALGYSEKEAQKALEAVDKRDSLESIIKNSLKFLMS
ncbi:Holliday junction branch migration protein RuvA [Clostridiaceae bacterium UIB06]|uniref:Holliday junction branch migration complex subunit RuvA n=1 Tax=Clostridium thailandense TaxID=2794346 RepID=A0A949X3U8_9CLOT|nr:Holliday junction branch migration protein RuvA [Clostridium thailandense]MBV7275314.1 Holliday junction branch migration protein RuvA [Clostridium thailandense]MCH5135830.1 Holliday junction branch migration protein RuvA [Clostridiaceae bacterium UIB06]